MRVSVLGCGRWGSFLSWYFNRLGHDVVLWGRSSSENLRRLQTEHSNGMVQLPGDIEITSDLEHAVSHGGMIIISISAQHLRSLASSIRSMPINGKTFVLCMKGLEEDTGLRLSQVAKETLPSGTRIAVWLGPGHVQDFLAGIPNCMVIDSEDNEVKRSVVDAFCNHLIRFYYGDDLIGNEVGAAAKNVIGIAAGMLDGLGYSSLKGALMSRGAREIARLIQAMGGKELSAYGLCHLGDYEATVFSHYSRNREYGELLIRGETLNELAEGVSTNRALMLLAKQYNIEMPICSAVHAVIHKEIAPMDMMMGLFLRSLKKEF
ncbi:MAG: NAD(P)H-dependent glycerol-3-phosphate dehydrogenase [Christensenellales bacterium]